MNISKTLGRLLGRSKKKKARKTPEDVLSKEKNKTQNNDISTKETLQGEDIVKENIPENFQVTGDSCADFIKPVSGDETNCVKEEDNEEYMVEEVNSAEPFQEETVDEITKFQKRKIKIDGDELKTKICVLLEHYLNSKEDINKKVSNREEVKSSIINFIESFSDSPNSEDATQQTEATDLAVGEINDLSETCQSLSTTSKKNIDYESISSMNFLSNETRSISFNLDKNCGGESVLSVLSALQAEFLKLKSMDNPEGREKSESKIQVKSQCKFQEKSEPKVHTVESRSSVEFSKKALINDRDHLNNMFEFLQEKINSMVVYEKEAAVSMGQLALDMQQFCSLIDLLRQWSNHNLNKLSNSLEKLKHYITKVITSSDTKVRPQRRIKIVLVRKSNQSLV